MQLHNKHAAKRARLLGKLLVWVTGGVCDKHNIKLLLYQ